MKKWAIIIAIIITLSLLLFLPLIFGIMIEKRNPSEFILGNSDQNKIKIKILKYHRGWFSSDVTAQLEISDKLLLQRLNELALQNPRAIILTIKTHVLHGPVFYCHTQHLPSRMGLAATNLSVVIPPEQSRFFSSLGIRNDFLKSYQTYISFSGNIFHHVELGPFYFITPKQQTLRFSSLRSDSWRYPGVKKEEGNFHLEQFTFEDGPHFLSIPKLELEFDMQEDKNGFWVGDNTLALSEIVLRNKGNKLFSATRVDLGGKTDQPSQGLLNMEKSLAIQRMQFENKSLGPFYLKISVGRLNMQAIHDLIAAYQTISERGELYESQMKEKMLMMIPGVLSPGANIKLNQLRFETKHGALNVNAELKWPMDKTTSPDSLNEFLKEARMQADFRVAKPLADELIRFLAKTLFLEQLTAEEKLRLQAMNVYVMEEAEQNSDVIKGLFQSGLIPKKAAKNFLFLLESKVTKEFYLERVKEYYFSKQISLDVALILQMNYSNLVEDSERILQLVNQLQISAVKDAHAQIDDFIKKGLIIQHDNDYIVSTLRENGVVTINGQKYEK